MPSWKAVPALVLLGHIVFSSSSLVRLSIRRPEYRSLDAEPTAAVPMFDSFGLVSLLHVIAIVGPTCPSLVHSRSHLPSPTSLLLFLSAHDQESFVLLLDAEIVTPGRRLWRSCGVTRSLSASTCFPVSSKLCLHVIPSFQRPWFLPVLGFPTRSFRFNYTVPGSVLVI